MLVHHSFLKIVMQQKNWCSRKKCFLNTKSAINYNSMSYEPHHNYTENNTE